MLRFVPVVLSVWCFVATACAADPVTLTIDCRTTGKSFRALHGVNSGPLNDGEMIDLTKYWQEAKIPLARLHDCEWPTPSVVDMHAVFPIPTADPAQASSYDFRQTDDYIAAVVKANAQIVYRLGESIEHSQRKYYVHPPADYQCWSDACLGIIRHYNEGWAAGHQYNIRYWEIWNEPDNRPAMWSGSDADYYRLYATAAQTIKAKYPDLKVGGPAVGATGKVENGVYHPTEFVAGFVKHCRDNKLPLDFFSWHTYTNEPAEYTRKSVAIRKWLDEQGFAKTEMHLNEWNYLPGDDWSPLAKENQGIKRQAWYDRMAGPEGAAFIAYALLDMQDAPLDQANLFNGDSGPFGLFTQHGAPKKTYHAVQAFSQLLDTPQRLTTTGGDSNKLAIAAGMNQDQTAINVLVSNYGSQHELFELKFANLPWKSSAQVEVAVIDAKHDLSIVDKAEVTPERNSLTFKLPAPGVMLLRVRPVGK